MDAPAAERSLLIRPGDSHATSNGVVGGAYWLAEEATEGGGHDVGEVRDEHLSD